MSAPLPAISPLASLDSLDRGLLHVFIGGPGTGEMVAVALPQAGWLVVDGARTGFSAARPEEQSLPVAILRKYRHDADTLRAYVLTHPHEDHADAAAWLLDTFPPERVVLAAPSPHGPHLLECARRWSGMGQGSDTMRALAHRQVVTALLAIERWERSAGHRVVAALDGVRLLAGDSEVTIEVRAPAGGPTLDAIFVDLERGVRRDANGASLVLEVLFGEARVVLGGDLPRWRTSTRQPIPTGWDAVLAAHPQLGGALLTKVPHHGSAAAQHPGLLTPNPDGSRAAAVTPFEWQRLPRVQDADGLPWLINRCGAIHVSSAPSDWQVTTKGPDVSRRSIRSRRDVEPTGDPFADAAADVRPAPLDDQLASVWAFALDANGSIRHRWAGARALLVGP